MKKRLVESLEMVLVSDPNICIVADNMVAEWGGVTYPQLSVILSHLKFLSSLHQNHHWITNGDPFYGDHLLFQRLYEGAIEDIDAIAEKSIGVGSTYNVDINLTTQQMHKLIQGSGMSSTIPQKSDLARSSYLAEMNFLKVVSQEVFRDFT